MPYRFITSCVNAIGSDIEEMESQSRQITYRTFLKYVPLSLACSVLGDGNLYNRQFPLKKDWAVKFYKGLYRKEPCVWINWSRIFFIFQ